MSLLSQPDGVPAGFDRLAVVPQDWIAIPDDAALFQELPYEREGLLAAGAPAPSAEGPPAEQEGSPAPAEEAGDPAAAEGGDGTDAPQDEVAPIDEEELD